jgi:hypothetical protein
MQLSSIMHPASNVPAQELQLSPPSFLDLVQGHPSGSNLPGKPTAYAPMYTAPSVAPERSWYLPATAEETLLELTSPDAFPVPTNPFDGTALPAPTGTSGLPGTSPQHRHGNAPVSFGGRRGSDESQDSHSLKSDDGGKIRSRLTRDQTAKLKAVYARTYFPDKVTKERLSHELHIPIRTIQIWFQNQRQYHRIKMKKRAHRLTLPQVTDGLTHSVMHQAFPPPPPSATVQYALPYFASEFFTDNTKRRYSESEVRPKVPGHPEGVVYPTPPTSSGLPNGPANSSAGWLGSSQIVNPIPYFAQAPSPTSATSNGPYLNRNGT